MFTIYQLVGLVSTIGGMS